MLILSVNCFNLAMSLQKIFDRNIDLLYPPPFLHPTNLLKNVIAYYQKQKRANYVDIQCSFIIGYFSLFNRKVSLKKKTRTNENKCIINL